MTKNNFIVLTFTIKLLLMKQLIYCKLCFINYCRTNRKMLNTWKYLPELIFCSSIYLLSVSKFNKKNWADYNISNYISLNTIVFGRIQDGTELFVVMQPPLRILTPFVLDNLAKLVLSLQRFSDLWYFHVKSKHYKKCFVLLTDLCYLILKITLKNSNP